MNDRIALGIFIFGIGVLLLVVSLIINTIKNFFILPLFLIITGFIIIINKSEDKIEQRRDKKKFK